MSEHPLLTIAIATFNRADDLKRCIRSVLSEPGDFFQVLVGDDASPDHTPQVVETYRRDPRVQSYRNDTNLGMQENYWRLLNAACGDYIFILTDDDYLLPGALAKIARVIHTNPEVGYILSDLPTVDETSGKVVNWHRTFNQDTLVPPSVENMAMMVRSAWVLSRQVLKREWIDWATWGKFRRNIFFPIIWSGRLLLRAPGYYLADALVRHTFFNRVYWSAFGADELEIEFNLAADRSKCMRAILHDYAPTPAVRRAIETWEANSLKSYLYAPRLGFYDLLKTIGVRSAWRKLSAAYTLHRAQHIELLMFPFKIPCARAWTNLKAIMRRLTPSLIDALQSRSRR